MRFAKHDDIDIGYYRELMDRLRDPSRAQLRHLQRAWLKDRDLRCDLDPMARDRERWFRAIEADPSKHACVTRLTQHRLFALYMKHGGGPEALDDWWHKTVPKPDWAQDGEPSAKRILSSNAVSKGKVYFEVSLNQAAMIPGTNLTLWIEIRVTLSLNRRMARLLGSAVTTMERSWAQAAASKRTSQVIGYSVSPPI